MICYQSIRRSTTIFTRLLFYKSDLVNNLSILKKLEHLKRGQVVQMSDFYFPLENHPTVMKSELKSEENELKEDNQIDSGEENPTTVKKKGLSKHQLKLEQRKQQKQKQQSAQSKKSVKKIQQQYLAIKSQLQMFHNCYIAQYGEERWNTQLFPGLIQPTKHVALMNKYVSDPTFAQALLKVNTGESLPYLSHYFDNVYIHSSDVTNASSNEINPQSSDKPSSDDILDDDNEASSKSPSNHRWPTPGISSSLDPASGLCCYYPLDAASLFPVLLLEAKPQHRILDMCSAPGGKALAILQSLNLHHFLPNSTHPAPPRRTPLGGLTCNDVSYDRKIRLQNVMRRYISREISDMYSVNIMNLDLTNYTLIKQYFGISSENNQNTNQQESPGGRFDRILLDAPCSSERHLLQEFYHDFPFLAPMASLNDNDEDDNHLFSKTQSIQMNQYDLLQWSIGRNKSNAERQYQLLLNAVKLINMSGRIVYSTCSIHELENDLLVQKVLQKVNKYEDKNGYTIEVVPVETLLPTLLHSNEGIPLSSTSLALGEKTSCGWQILPDRSSGFGPIYLSVLTKRKFEGAEKESLLKSSTKPK